MNKNPEIPCFNCGSILTLPPNTNFLSCQNCGTALKVSTNGSVIYTEAINQNMQKNGTVKNSLPNNLNLSNRQTLLEEMALLEHSWMNEQEQYKIRGQLVGVMYTGELLQGFWGLILGGISLYFFFQVDSASYDYLKHFTLLAGSVFTIAGLYIINRFVRIKRKYDKGFAQYQQKRLLLEQQLKETPSIK